jgi:DNA replication and repair protein RecF
MHLHRLVLTNFKNYENSELEFSPRINCFVGNNGVGKTNILDAIHYLSMTKSFFNSVENMSIRHGEDFFIVSGVFNGEDGDSNIVCSFMKQKQKSLKCNGKEYERFSDHVGRYPAVMVSPADSVLVTGGSEERRRFLNMIISQYDHQYLDALMYYNRALLGRNKLLKEYAYTTRFDEEMISSFDYQLARYGTLIHKARISLIERLVPIFQDYYNIISKSREEVQLNYRSQLNGDDLTILLSANRDRDRQLQYTTSGIHKDDLEFMMGGHPVKQLGSQGQQKSYLVALKLAKFSYIADMSGTAPMLLLDDLFDKFDADRVEQMINLVGNHRFGQIFITDTHQSRLQQILEDSPTDYKLFMIGGEGVEETISNGN